MSRRLQQKRDDCARNRVGTRLKNAVQSVSALPLGTTVGGIGSNQTRDQISGWSFLLPFVFSAAARRLQAEWEGPR
jgi:hypothetical protein